MAILSGDVKLVASQVMEDVPEGGGGPTANVIPDGGSNNIFPDISELDRAGGRVNLRKTHVHVQSNNRDAYLGANLIVAAPPNDPNVAITLFSTKEAFDRRADAVTRIEAYLNKGAEYGGFLFENHIAGQRVIQLLQRVGTAVPNVGQTLVLVEDEGLGSQKEQYVRATDVSVVERTFTYNVDKDYTAAVVTVAISDALRFDFTGSSANREFVRSANSARVRETVVADAGTYAGVVPLVQAASIGDFSLKGSSIYTQLVPSAQTETPISFAPPYAAAGLPVPGAASVSYTAGHTWDTNTDFSLPGGCLPGSLLIVTDGITITDDAGNLKTSSGVIGSIDYANGILSLNAGAMSNSKAVTYTPAAQVLRAPQSTEIPVTLESRSQSYVGTVVPIAEPGTLSISYMAQGRWYVLSDGGNGVLSGIDAAYGAGTFNTDTGAFVVTLGALPDVGSSLVLTWNVPTQETQHPSATVKASQVLSLSPPVGTNAQPGSLTVTWPHESGTGTRTASAAVSGVISGDATGMLNVAQNQVTFAPNVLPAVGAILTVDYTAGPKQEDTFSHPSRDGLGKVPVTATLGAIEPGSLEVEWNTLTDTTVLGVYTVAQMGAMGMGVFMVDPTQYAHDDGVGNLILSGATVGSVNYTTGEVSFNPDVNIKIPSPRYRIASTLWGLDERMYRLNYSGIEYVTAPSLYPNDESGYVKLRYNSAGSPSSQTETIQFAPSFKLVPDVAAQVVPGSILLQAPGSQPWGDSGQGVLRESTTSGWLTRGSIDYLTGAVTLTTWLAGQANSITRASCVTTVGENISSEYVFRTAAAPLRPGSLSIQFARATGGTQTVTAGIDGTISATGVSGSVDYETGLTRIRFGTVVVAAGNESEPWFNAIAVDGSGNIFRPEPVAASTIKYSAVAYSYLPLDASILGIDPVRLPSDGRVPIFRPGGFAVVGNKQITTPQTVANSDVIDTGRTRLSRARLIGADGVTIAAGYTADLEAGTVTITDITGFNQPVHVEHRIEDMVQVSDVQINGTLGLTRALTHDFPTTGTYVSSALVAGDVRARTQLVFDQVTWKGTWQDTPDGAGATGEYDQINFPVAVINAGAVTERWALIFTSSSGFNILGEHLGVIGTGTINAVTAPTNPITGQPYFTLAEGGWGAGWSVGNVLRINTIGAQVPVWIARTVQPGPEAAGDYSFELLVRGDVDAPAP